MCMLHMSKEEICHFYLYDNKVTKYPPHSPGNVYHTSQRPGVSGRVWPLSPRGYPDYHDNTKRLNAAETMETARPSPTQVGEVWEVWSRQRPLAESSSPSPGRPALCRRKGENGKRSRDRSMLLVLSVWFDNCRLQAGNQL